MDAIVGAVLGAMKEVGGQDRSPTVLLKCFGWAQLLLAQCPVKVLQSASRGRLLDAALAALKRPEQEVALAALQLIANLVAPSWREPEGPSSMVSAGLATVGEKASGASLASSLSSDSGEAEDLFSHVCGRVLRQLAEDGEALRSRGELVVRKFCEGVDAERFFTLAARAVTHEQDVGFARRLVRVLNRVLFTARETRALRARLRQDSPGTHS